MDSIVLYFTFLNTGPLKKLSGNQTESKTETSLTEQPVPESQVPEDFILHTQAKIQNQEPVFATYKLFTTTNLGALERLKQNWPIVLGTFLSILVVAGTLVALWKTGVLAKMRPYQLDEEEVKRERRKSSMRLSVRYSKADHE